MTASGGLHPVLSATLSGLRLPKNPEPGDALERDLGIDSLALLELVQALENRLCVPVPDEETARLRTVADLHALVERLTAGAHHPIRTSDRSSP